MLTITPTRLSILRRLRGAIKAAYLRALIRATERDLFWHEADLARMPLQIKMTRGHLEGLRIELMDVELAALGRVTAREVSV